MSTAEENVEAIHRKSEELNYKLFQTPKWVTPFLHEPQSKRKLIKKGLAELLLHGDWRVNRTGKEVEKSTGVISNEELEAFMLYFYQKKGILENDEKLVHFHAGCGNGSELEQLRQADAIHPFDEKLPLSHYWEQVGYADKIYFTLNDLLLNLIKKDKKNEPAFTEFVDVISTLILRKISFEKEYNKKSGEKAKKLLDLPSDINLIRDILLRAKEYFPRLGRMETLSRYGKFVCEEPVVISPECQELLREFYNSPKTFLTRYFDSKFQITASSPKDQPNDLTKDIKIYPSGVIINKFEKLGTVLPEGSLFDIASSFRSTSHLGNKEYRFFLEELCLRLKPGGIITEDGFLESYTKDVRITELANLQKKLGSEFKIEVVCHEGKGPTSILIQRGIEKSDNQYDFFSEEEKSQLLVPDHFLISANDFIIRFSRFFFRSLIIKRLKNFYMNGGDNSKEKLKFCTFQQELNAVLRGEVFTSAEWKEVDEALQHDNTGDSLPLVFTYADRTLESVISSQVDAIRRKMETALLSEAIGAAPLRYDITIQTFPVKDSSVEGNAINKKRHIPLPQIPRNLDLPSLDDLEKERSKMVKKLKEIIEITGKPPLVVKRFGDCFTNPLMLDTLHQILGKKGVRNLIRIEEGNSVENNSIYVIEGSLSDVYDRYGMACTKEFAIPLLEQIESGGNIRFAAMCFGHQIITQACSQLTDIPIHFDAQKGSLQFGMFPCRMGVTEHPGLKHLSAKTLSLFFSRTGYVFNDGLRARDLVKPLGFECDGKDGKNLDELPPVGFSVLGGKGLTFQPHLEVQASNSKHRRFLRRYLGRNSKQLAGSLMDIGQMVSRKGGFGNSLVDRQIKLRGRDRSGAKVSWVRNEAGPAFWIPAIDTFAADILRKIQ